MQTDRELLELAAKAAGYGVHWLEDEQAFYGYFPSDIRNDDYPWNPLTDDGDALRLAVKLWLLVDCSDCCAMALDFDFPDREWWGGGKDERAGIAHEECDPYAATRRAIVRAAAEIGKGMKDAD